MVALSRLNGRYLVKDEESWYKIFWYDHEGYFIQTGCYILATDATAMSKTRQHCGKIWHKGRWQTNVWPVKVSGPGETPWWYEDKWLKSGGEGNGREIKCTEASSRQP